LAESLLAAYRADAEALASRGVASRRDIDTAMRLGAGYPVGPFGTDITPDAADGASGERPWQRVAVLGTGRMASGIAEALARAGTVTTVIGRSDQAVARAETAITRGLERSVQRGRLTADDVDSVAQRLAFVPSLDSLPEVDLVIEAVSEHLATKQSLLEDVALRSAPDAVLATNTSSFRVAEVMRRVPESRPTLALHFFNPATAMKLVEIVSGPGGDAAAATATTWVRSIGKVPVDSADTRGFIVNRLLIPYLNDAVRRHEEGESIDRIDAAMVQAGLPMGPFALLDMIGLDVAVAALDSMADTDPDPRLRPRRILRDLVAQGRLGRKSGGGFYSEGS
jgi:3-hydroxybutyryl-CoA dehydrogenase